MDVIEGRVKHNYRLHGDNMQELLPPCYQKWFDSLPELTGDELDSSLDALVAESKERDNVRN